MKVERKEVEQFKPVVVTLDARFEVLVLRAALNDLVANPCRGDAYRDMAAKMSRDICNVVD